MTTNAPKFSEADEVYIRSSAAVGFLEVVQITGQYRRGNEWMYSIATGIRQPNSPNVYGNRQSLVTGSILYLTEDELVLKCEAYRLAEANILAQYNKIKALRSTYCPQDPTLE